jgi:hypothetical protein
MQLKFLKVCKKTFKTLIKSELDHFKLQFVKKIGSGSDEA